MKKALSNKHFKFIILALIANLSILVYKDIPISHDILFHLSRIKAISVEMSINPFNGFIFTSMLNNMGYAIPLFYPSLLLYPFAFLYKSCSIVFVYKIMMFSINLVTLYVIDYVLRKLSNNEKLINFGAILYLFSSYRMVDLYVRGAIGEALSFIFLPFVILGIEEIVYGDKKHFYYLVIGMTGIIYSHVITSYMVFLFILFYLFFNIKKIFKDKRYLYLIYAVIITFFLTSAFILPLLEQLIDRKFFIYYLDQMDTFNNISVPLYKTFLAIPLPSKEWFPLGIGLIYLIIVIFGIKYRNMLKKNDLVYLILGIVFLLLSTDLVPRFIYNKLLFFIQYQWRFYMLATISLFYFGLRIYKHLKEREVNILKIALVINIIVICTDMFVTNCIYYKTNSLNNEYLGFYEYLPEGVTYSDITTNNIQFSSNNPLDCHVSYNNGITTINYRNNDYNNTIITLPLLYYKGYVSNKNYDIINNDGKVSVKLHNSNDVFEVYYEGTIIAYIGRIISLMTVIVIISIYIRKRSNNVKIKSCN